MFWETSADQPGARSIIGTMVNGLGNNLEQSQNWLEYPQSQYDNMRAGMPGQ
jgi:chitinase